LLTELSCFRERLSKSAAPCEYLSDGESI
jgi:hypothetical protein